MGMKNWTPMIVKTVRSGYYLVCEENWHVKNSRRQVFQLRVYLSQNVSGLFPCPDEEGLRWISPSPGDDFQSKHFVHYWFFFCCYFHYTLCFLMKICYPQTYTWKARSVHCRGAQC